MVRKRNKRWHYDFQVRGVRHRGSIPEATNRAQAERAEAQIKLDVFERKFGDGISANFAGFVAEVYQPWATTKRSYKSEKGFIKTLVEYFKTSTLAELSPMAVERFKRQRLATPVRTGSKPRRPASVNREVACLSRICSMAIDNGLLQTNPCRKVKRLREDNTRTRYLTDAEESQLMAAIAPHYERLRPLIIVALNTGMRQGEICSLKWSQIDWQRDLITVTNTKSGADRVIPMTTQVRELLITRWREADRSEPRIFDEEPGPVSACFHRLSKSAGLVDFKFHDLRHTFATRLAAHTDAFTLAALLGHKTLAMTMRYTHATDTGKRRAISALDSRKPGQENVTIDFPAVVENVG